MWKVEQAVWVGGGGGSLRLLLRFGIWGGCWDEHTWINWSIHGRSGDSSSTTTAAIYSIGCGRWWSGSWRSSCQCCRCLGWDCGGGGGMASHSNIRTKLICNGATPNSNRGLLVAGKVGDRFTKIEWWEVSKLICYSLASLIFHLPSNLSTSIYINSILNHLITHSCWSVTAYIQTCTLVLTSWCQE